MKPDFNKSTARLAGVFYLIVILTGFFSLAYIPGKLFFWDNPQKTFNEITNHEFLFRLSIVSSAICYSAFLMLPLILYKLLHHLHDNYAKVMVALAVVSVPISLINLLNKFSVLSLISHDNYSNIYSAQELNSQVMFYLNQYDSGILITMIFWGLWLFPFGYLVYKSGVIPKLLGVLLMLGCFGYLINFTGNMLIHNYSSLGISKYISLPASLGEIGTCLWLLIFGIRKR
ncbi:hypothetical protein BAX94_07500 [Elizabethkingia meningoseptica]|uniref:DUF4386 domain-containing protein n=1 Tax=Elizabethkingia meningoseptica TaxID=238 RepID=A0A1V3U1C4_ELIME|nr:MULTISPECIES: DUF4386 domain-containing protein [Elizabethkingia]AQX13415.1 hypothetical protein BBD35_14010 [Elizabethkingia meningoseptica]MBG0515054.1 DUF4386 domain-containing protein [Elizabethkingia meningoseptica]MDE5434446.1 DUF4386 domain-containing protein [Elizabethkingia meningoseptica]MDE5467330.1 DUF4386 domain-containing protein [Elizabethkingia meningoseptica]MDE5470787.1 DUF4386 domain-containing protein [Elizabethkingia meningoseptica]